MVKAKKPVKKAQTPKGSTCPHCGGKVTNGICTKCGYPVKGKVK
jgi:ribosomal protein L32